MKKQVAIRFLRNSFPRLESQACMVCGKYKSIAHMHHVISVSDMAAYFEKYGVDVFDAVVLGLSVVWLCPNHHALWHATRGRGLTKQSDAYADLSREELEAFERLSEIEREAASEFLGFIFSLPGVKPFEDRRYE